jgi:hypothetical protein
VAWLVQGNVPLRWALVATALTWAAIPVLWSVNEWGVLSLAELFWLLLVTAGWLFSAAGLALASSRDLALAATIFVWSSVIPTMLGLLIFLAYALEPGTLD